MDQHCLCSWQLSQGLFQSSLFLNDRTLERIYLAIRLRQLVVQPGKFRHIVLSDDKKFLSLAVHSAQQGRHRDRRRSPNVMIPSEDNAVVGRCAADLLKAGVHRAVGRGASWPPLTSRTRRIPQLAVSNSPESEKIPSTSAGESFWAICNSWTKQFPPTL